MITIGTLIQKDLEQEIKEFTADPLRSQRFVKSCLLSWDQTPVTMTGGCTTACKGRFGHPDKKRTTISVREAALIQTFPRGYKFETDRMEAVCDMIGNAVPPKFSCVAGKIICKVLKTRSGSNT